MRSLLEPKGPRLATLKSTFNAENFVCWLSWSKAYRQPFCRNSLTKCVSQLEITKNLLNSLFWVFRVVQGHQC